MTLKGPKEFIYSIVFVPSGDQVVSSGEIVRVWDIHPFHPLYGQTFSLVTFRQNWAEDKVYYHDDQERLKSLPSSYTDILPADPFIVLSGKESLFHPQHMLALLRLMESLQQRGEEQND